MSFDKHILIKDILDLLLFNYPNLTQQIPFDEMVLYISGKF